MMLDRKPASCKKTSKIICNCTALQKKKTAEIAAKCEMNIDDYVLGHYLI